LIFNKNFSTSCLVIEYADFLTVRSKTFKWLIYPSIVDSDRFFFKNRKFANSFLSLLPSFSKLFILLLTTSCNSLVDLCDNKATRGGLEPPSSLRNTGLATLRHTGLGYLVNPISWKAQNGIDIGEF
jgi:hypothetical protein